MAICQPLMRANKIQLAAKRVDWAKLISPSQVEMIEFRTFTCFVVVPKKLYADDFWLS